MKKCLLILTRKTEFLPGSSILRSIGSTWKHRPSPIMTSLNLQALLPFFPFHKQLKHFHNLLMWLKEAPGYGTPKAKNFAFRRFKQPVLQPYGRMSVHIASNTNVKNSAYILVYVLVSRAIRFLEAL